jgi:PAS domain S-box-containing protein
MTATHIGEIVNLSHEFAMGLAEHFDVLHKVSMGNLKARISGTSSVALLESLKVVTNEMIQSVSTEISKRKQIEKALKISETQARESEEKYRMLFEYAPNSIFVLELRSLKILDVNARALEVYGYEKEDLIGKSFMELGAGLYSEGILSNKATQEGALCSVYTELQHRRKDGTTFYVNVYACQTMRMSKYGIIATTVDITEALAKETQLIQASKMSTLGVMATGVAHELNQPLTTIQIGADVLKSMNKEGKVITSSFLDMIAEQMVEQVSRAVSIIKHLREFGRKTETRREKININVPLKGVFNLLSQQLKVRDIRLVLELEETLPFIIGDKNRLEQVFIDLIINARDAMVEKQNSLAGQSLDNTLTARTFEREGRVVAAISDTGTGIPDEIRENIFEPFFTTKKVGEGTGLGLSISYGIVKDYGGSIEIESEIGKGTTFELSFPCLAE